MYTCPLDDPDYIVQGCYSDSRVCESSGSTSESEAVQVARAMLKDSTFEGDYVVVITREGELVYDSRPVQRLGCAPDCFLCNDLDD